MADTRLLVGLSVCGALVLLVGCSASGTVQATGALLKTTVSTTGRLAGEVFKAGGSVAKSGVQAVAGVVRPGVVTVVQESGSTVRRLPWKEGLTLYAVTRKAELDAGVKAVQVLRGGEVIERDAKEMREGRRDLKLEAGDVIRLVR